MEKILLDSSVWVSLFARDVNYQKAMDIMVDLLSLKIIIVVPIVVYIEVINTLKRLKFDKKYLKSVMEDFCKNKDIEIVYPNKQFWHKKVRIDTDRIQLKTLDLLILSFALESRVDRFYSFDRRLAKAYLIMK